jgi:hypothetical protein
MITNNPCDEVSAKSVVRLDQRRFVTQEETSKLLDERHRMPSNGSNGWRNFNLRTTVEKVVRRSSQCMFDETRSPLTSGS